MRSFRAVRNFSTTAKRLSQAPKASTPNASSGNGFVLAFVAAAGGAGAYYYYANSPAAKVETFNATKADYQKVYDAIADKMVEDDDYDDGSYGPVLLRLAWHSSGTYNKDDNKFGSSGGTMRFNAEASHGANNGLVNARNFLKPIQEKFPWISTGDLYTLGGVTAVQELGGPVIPWKRGRGATHVRNVFNRQGFNDQEMVALIGAHALGRCHTQNSGYEGPWTFSPTMFTNDFYKLLLDDKWQWKKWDGPKQYEDAKTKSLMMLPTDMALATDKNFKKWAVAYAKDQDLFFKDFSAAFSKMLNNGVDFPQGTEVWEFKTKHA
ncbi:Cytochrome c peroxidase [Yarrowia sp. C11]|nr:Cytochrome c peroxidase [Yarrowia sp. C11]